MRNWVNTTFGVDSAVWDFFNGSLECYIDRSNNEEVGGLIVFREVVSQADKKIDRISMRFDRFTKII